MLSQDLTQASLKGIEESSSRSEGGWMELNAQARVWKVVGEGVSVQKVRVGSSKGEERGIYKWTSKKSRWSSAKWSTGWTGATPVGPVKHEPGSRGSAEGATGWTGASPVGPVRLEGRSWVSATGATGRTDGSPVGPVRHKTEN
jgi:hypothetical protein